MKKLFCIFLFLLACGKKDIDEKKAEPSDFLERLRERYKWYLDEEIKKTWDVETGWPDAKDCDGLLWAGLAKAAGVSSVKLELAEYEPGKLHRRPKSPCWANGQDLGSKSTISRDMVLGWLWGSTAHSDWDAIKRFQQRGEDKNWVIGDPWPERPGEVLMNGNLIGLLGRISCSKWDYCPPYKYIEALHEKSEKDYVRHLTTLFILLDSKVDDMIKQVDITENSLEMLKWNHEKDPNDLLFEAAYRLFTDGKFDNVISGLLSDNMYYPSYVRGSSTYVDVYWLFTAKLVLDQF